MARLLRIEYLLGRSSENRNTARTADLDILFFGKMKLESELLTLPHPRLHLRKFVLCPLTEICPDLIHPTLNRTAADLLATCPDPSHVARWNPNAQNHHNNDPKEGAL